MSPGPGFAPESTCWYVVQSRPRQELLAAAAIEVRTALDVFVPEILETRRGRKARRPLFPGYLFVATNPEALPLHTINKTPGVLRVVGFDGIPRAVETDVVTALRARCESINAEGGLPQHSYKPGDPVRVTDGPLAGLEGVFQGPMTPSARVQVLLTFLRQAQTVNSRVIMYQGWPPKVYQRCAAKVYQVGGVTPAHRVSFRKSKRQSGGNHARQEKDHHGHSRDHLASTPV